MKDIVSFETALRLKEAGFPQPGYPIPDPADVMGRVMYDADGDKFMCFWQDGDGGGVISLTPYMNNKQECKNPLVFAPTATDILRELPEGTMIENLGGGMFCVEYNNGQDYDVAGSLSECVAKRWLRLNEK